MLEFKSRKLKFKFNDETYELNFPTVEQLLNYESERVEKEADTDHMFNFLEKLGLEQNVSRSMEIGHITQIFGEFNKEKK